MMLPEALRNLQLMTLVICLLLLPLVIALFESSGEAEKIGLRCLRDFVISISFGRRWRREV